MNRDVLIINIVLNSHSSHNKNIPHPETLAAQLKPFLGHQKHQLNDVHQLYIAEWHCLSADGHRKHRSLSKQPQLSHFPSQSQQTIQSHLQNNTLSFASKPSKPPSFHLPVLHPTLFRITRTSPPIIPRTFQSQPCLHPFNSQQPIRSPLEYNKPSRKYIFKDN